MSETLTADGEAILGPERDPRRLDAVRRTGLLDTPPEEAFDALTRLAARALEVPVALLSLVDGERDFHKSRHGLPEPLAGERELRGATLCRRVVAAGEPLAIPDTRADPEYRDNPAVERLGAAAYLGVPLRMPDGQVVGSFGAIDRVPRRWTEREVEVMRGLAASAVREIELRAALRRAEEQARELDRVQHYHDLVESLDAIVWEMDVATWRFTYVSPEAEALLGHPLERWYDEDGFWAERLVHPEDRGWAVPFCVGATEEARDHEFDYRAVAADGRVVWLRDVVRVIRDQGGRAVLLRGVMTDVTEQKRAEEALREREAQLAEAQRLARVGSWEWSPATGRVTWSDQMYRIYGLEPQSEECTFESYLARVLPEDRAHVQERIGRAVETGEPFDFEERIVRPDGEVRRLRSRGMVIREGTDGPAASLVGTCQDVTEQQQLAEREVELARSQAARDWAEAAERRAAFLADAGKLLSSSLDYQTTLHNFARLVVPAMADWCAVDVLEDGEPRRVVTAHPDPDKERLARDLAERFPAAPDAAHGLPAVLRSGEPELVAEIPDELLVASAVDDEHLRILRELGLRSFMVVPLIARGRTLGAITFVAAESDRRYGPDDLRLAQDLAHRAAIAVDNARLYRLAEQASEQNSRILESITDAFFALDTDWRFSYVNREAERVLHRPAEQLLGRSIWDEFPEAVGSSFERAYREAAERKRTVQFEELYAPLDTWFEVRAYPAPDGLSVFFRDVSEQKRAEQALRESEERYRFLSAAIPVQVWTAQPDGRLDYVSPQVAQYFGWPEERIVGEGWQSLVHPDDLGPVVARWTRALESGEPYEAQFRLRSAEGEYRWHISRALARRDAGGSVAQWFGTNTDIQDQKEAEAERERLIAALDAERRRLEHIFENAPAAIAVARGPEHRFVSANPAYRRMVGGRDLVGRTAREAFPELEGQGLLELLDRVFSTGEPFVGNETHVEYDRDGDGRMETGYFNFVYQPLFDFRGEVTGVMTFAIEVSGQVRARQEVEAKAEEMARLARALEVTNRELDQFAYVASHDLKAPLRGIANLSQWIEEDLQGEVSQEVKEHLELMRGRVHRMEGLIDGILQYSRVGRVREKPETVEVGALLHEVVDLLSPPDHFRVRIAGAMPTLFTERLPLQQVLLNLIGNAVKYNRSPEPWVEVGAEERGDEVHFRVADNGPGIAPEYHDRIFGIFQTLQARDQVEGTGIGLSLVRKILDNRGGRVWVESEEGVGSTFHFVWPRQGSVEERGA